MPVQLNIPANDFWRRVGKIKGIVFDLDDTLLDFNKEITKETQEVIAELQKKGYFISICTARNYTATQYYANILAIDGVYSSVNGCQIVDAKTCKIIKSIFINDEVAVQLVDYCLQHEYPFSLSVGEDSYISPIVSKSDLLNPLKRKRKLMPDGYHMREPRILSDASVLHGQTVYKIVIHASDLYNEIKIGLEKLFPDVQCVITSKGIINIYPVGSDKGTGLLDIARETGLTADEMCVFGDFANDIDMFRVAGLSFAMGNANLDVQMSADAVTGRNDENGVMKALAYTFLK